MSATTSMEPKGETQDAWMSDPNQVYIAVLGPTGAGKSTFINLVSGSNLKSSKRLDSCTEIVQAGNPFELDGRTVTLIDTPGFDDSSRSQMTILKEIASHLESQYKLNIKLHGVLFFHRINDNRVGGIARKNFFMFLKLVGDETLKNVTIVTTMWDRVSEEEGEERLEELCTGERLFKPALDHGADITRHHNNLENAQDIIRRILDNHPLPLSIQEELVDQGKDITQTAAGYEVDRQVAELIQKHQKEMQELVEQMKEVIELKDEEARKEIEKETRALQAEMDRVRDEQRNMQADYQRQRADIEEGYKQLQDAQIRTLKAESEVEMLKRERELQAKHEETMHEFKQGVEEAMARQEEQARKEREEFRRQTFELQAEINRSQGAMRDEYERQKADMEERHRQAEAERTRANERMQEELNRAAQEKQAILEDQRSRQIQAAREGKERQSEEAILRTIQESMRAQGEQVEAMRRAAADDQVERRLAEQRYQTLQAELAEKRSSICVIF